MNETMERLGELLAQVKPELDQSHLTPDSRLIADLGLNSIQMMLLAMEIEDTFGFEFDEYQQVDTIGDVCDAICAVRR